MGWALTMPTQWCTRLPSARPESTRFWRPCLQRSQQSHDVVRRSGSNNVRVASTSDLSSIDLQERAGGALPMRTIMNSNTSGPTPAEVVFFNGKIATQDD